MVLFLFLLHLLFLLLLRRLLYFSIGYSRVLSFLFFFFRRIGYIVRKFSFVLSRLSVA